MKSLPKRTAEEKEFRSKMISSVKNITIAKKTQESNKYKNGRDYDESVLIALFGISDSLTLKIGEAQKELKQAKESKQDTKELKTKLSALHREQQITENKIKTAKKRGVLYNRVNKPLNDAKKCIARYESYQRFANTI
jgi:predicted flavoprotein YhiN